jgi:hypothetical protein
MSKEELDNLVRINRLKVEPGSRGEFAGMLNPPAHVCSMPRMRALIPTANLTWRTARHIGWRSQHYATEDTDRKIALPFSRPSFIRWVRIMLTCKFFLRPTTNETLQNTKAVWRLTKVFWPI